MQTVPAIVNQLQSQFLANVQAGLGSCGYLSGSSQETVARLLETNASPQAVADALFGGFAEHWARQRAELADSLSGATGRSPYELSFHGVSRLFQPLPGCESPPSGLRPGRETYVKNIMREERPEAQKVLEFHYPMEVAEMIKPIAEDQLEGLHDHLCAGGLSLYSCDESRLSIRLPSLTAFEIGLKIFNPRRAAKFCMTAGISTRDDLNELHRLGYHAVALPLEETPVHRSEPEHPLEVALHDVFHAALWPMPWLRQSAVLFYDSLKILSPEDRPRLEEQEMLIQDLAVRNAEDLNVLFERSTAHLKPSVAHMLLEDYLARLDTLFASSGPHHGVRVLKGTLHQLLSRG